MKYGKTVIAALSALSIFSCSLIFTAVSSDPPRALSSRETAACIRAPACHKRFVVAHRINGFGAPENSREASKKAVAAGVPVVEVDVRMSRDGYLYLLHDHSLNRTTTATGNFGDKTAAELALVQLKGNHESLPRLEDIYEIVKGKTMLYLDIKGGVVEQTVEWITQHGSFNDVIFCVNSREEFEQAARMKQKYPAMIIAAEAYSQKDAETIRNFFPRLPDIIDVGFPTARKFAPIDNADTKIYASALVFEIAFPFLQPLFPLYINLWNIDLLETNRPLFWIMK